MAEKPQQEQLPGIDASILPTKTSGSIAYELPSLATTTQVYRAHLRSSRLSPHSSRNFLYDLALFGRFFGPARPLAGVTPSVAQAWLASMRDARPALSDKTIYRRIAALRHFFAWLTEEGLLPANALASIVVPHLTSPLPTILTDDEVTALMALAAGNPRSALIINLLLSTGIKKGELRSLRLSDFDISDPHAPLLWVAHDRRHRFKDRVLPLPRHIPSLLTSYAQSRPSQEALFDCTPRALEYVIAGISERLGCGKRITAQTLRDTYAVRQLRDGMPVAEMMIALGLAKNDWNQETQDRYRKLAE